MCGQLQLPGLLRTLVADLIQLQLTHAQNPMNNRFDLLLLDYSLEFYIRLQQETSVDNSD